MTEQLSIELLHQNIGQTWLTLSYPIERGMVQRFVEAVGDDNLRWQGKNPEAPPALLLTIGFERVVAMLLTLPEVVLHGSTEFECFKPVKVGDVITVIAKISSLRERPPITFINLELELYNQQGLLAARCKQLALLRSKA
jgi:hypothetical protein